MKVLLIAYNYTPDNNGGVKRPVAMKRELSKFGIDVSILTHGPLKFEHSDGVIRVGHDLSQNNFSNKISKIYRAIDRKVKLFFKIKNTYYDDWRNKCEKSGDKIINIVKPDVIICSYPPVECLQLGLFFSKKYNIKLVADYRDPLIDETAEVLVRDKYPFLFDEYKQLDKDIINSASLISVIAPSMKDYYKNNYGVDSCQLIPNGYDGYLNKEALKKSHNSPISNEIIRIVYTGTLSYFDKDRSLIEFFSAIKKGLRESSSFSRLRVDLYGDILLSDIGDNQQLVDTGIISIKGKMPMEDIAKIQRDADYLILLTGTDRKCVATGKIFEYIISGTPILGLTKNTYAENIIDGTGTGECVNPRDVNLIYLKLMRIIEANFKFSPSIDEIKKFDRKYQMKELANLLMNKI